MVYWPLLNMTGDTLMNITAKAREDGSIDVTDGDGHWMTFTLDELRTTTFDINPGHIAGAVPLTGSDALDFLQDGWKRAREFAIEHGKIPSGL